MVPTLADTEELVIKKPTNAPDIGTRRLPSKPTLKGRDRLRAVPLAREETLRMTFHSLGQIGEMPRLHIRHGSMWLRIPSLLKEDFAELNDTRCIDLVLGLVRSAQIK
jgi:hypothetical protein